MDEKKIMNENQFTEIKNTIRGLKILTEEQKNNISRMNESQKEEIIILYNYMMKYFMEYVAINYEY